MMSSVRARLASTLSEGWVSLALVAVLAVVVGWSLDDAALVLGRRNDTDFLPWVALAGVAVGFVGAQANWNRPVAHLVGAAFAALIVPLAAGAVLEPGASLSAQYTATATATTNAVLDFAVRGLQLTRETGHYLVVLGLLCWANGQFVASAVFRRGRPLGPIVVLGTVLVANMSATRHDQIWFLVLFSMAALFLLTRLHALDERATWVRRRIGDPSTVGSLYLRGGTVFILIAVFGALTLTASARSAPLAGVWDGARPLLIDVTQWLQRIIPPAPDSKTLGIPSFGQQVVIGGVWSPRDEPALVIRRPSGNDDRFYWRAVTYDSFTLWGWKSSTPNVAPRPAGESLLDGTLDAIPESAARTPITFRVEPQSNFFNVAFSPIDPLAINRDATVDLSGANGYFHSITIESGVPYDVAAAVPTIADVAGGTTENRLRSAGQDYPAGVAARYLDVPKGAIGPNARTFLSDIEARVKAAGKNNPFDLATAMVDVFRDGSKFSYETNVAGVCDDSPSISECFATYKRGYCEYYASTMVVLLRDRGIAARMVEGFLPGKLNVATGVETISTAGSHAWVEVYFPGYGWHIFDPTGGGRAQPQEIIEGSPVPLVTPRPSASLGSPSRDPRDGPDPTRRPGSALGGPDDPTAGGNTAIAISLVIVLLATVGLTAFLAWRRGPRGATTPEGVYASVSGIARRFGFGPRPTQTAFEYASALGDILPGVRPELQTVAAAKVEVAYGRRELGDDRIRALRTSYRRLRVALLRLALRRGDRRRMR